MSAPYARFSRLVPSLEQGLDYTLDLKTRSVHLTEAGIEALERGDHVVAQVVEAELVVGAVGDVRVVGSTALGCAGLVQIDAINRQTQIAVNRTHPLAVALCQVGVHRDQVGAPSGQRVQEERHRRDQRLAFARRHFSDVAAV